MLVLAQNNGYYHNVSDRNGDFGETDPILADHFPYWPYLGDQPWQHHLLFPDANFVDTGNTWIDTTPWVGTTTDPNSLPDEGMIDLGFHYTDWSYVGHTETNADLDDVTTLAEYWLCWSPFDPNSPAYLDPNLYDPNFIFFGGDWNNDSFVDMTDFAVMSEAWKKTNPPIVPVISGDPNEGRVLISASQCNSATRFVYAYVNGKYIGPVYMLGTDTPKFFDMSEWGNGSLEIKFVEMDNKGSIFYSPPYELTHTLPLSYCILPATYEPNEPISFAAYNPDTGTVNVSLYGNGGELAWSQDFTGNTIGGQIPADVISQLLTVDSINFTASNGKGPIIKPFPVKHFGSIDKDVRALLVMPDTSLFDYNPHVRYLIVSAFQDRGIKFLTLEREQATWKNVADYGRFGSIRYLYFLGHGNYKTDKDDPDAILRTWNVFADTCVVSCKYSEFPAGSAPSWCKPLPESLENSLPTWASMNFDRLTFVYNDSCYGGRLKINNIGNLVEGGPGQQGMVYDSGTHSDITLALRLDDSYEARAYHGWWHEGWFGRFNKTSFQKWGVNIWTELKTGASINDAVTEAIVDSIDNGDYNDPLSALHTYRLRGQGNILSVYLKSYGI